MELKNSTPPINTENRRDFIKKIGFLGATVLASPLLDAAGKISSSESKNNAKYKKFVINQVKTILEIIADKKYDQILSNSYLVYCLYCLQSFLDEVSDPQNQHYVPEKIIGSVAHLITPEFRVQAILSLEKQTRDKEHLENKKISNKEVLPLKKFTFGQGENHNNAIDLFALELSSVHSVGSGLVVVADNGWHPNNELSTSSFKGGNTVIVFNYLTKEFFRYAHLGEVVVKKGELVMEGENLGTVGHTGKNASRSGHGQHLHFEIHKYLSDKDTNQTILAKDLKKLLENLQHLA